MIGAYLNSNAPTPRVQTYSRVLRTTVETTLFHEPMLMWPKVYDGLDEQCQRAEWRRYENTI